MASITVECAELAVGALGSKIGNVYDPAANATVSHSFAWRDCRLPNNLSGTKKNNTEHMANFFFHSYLLCFTHHSFCFWSVDTSCWASSQDVECSTREQRMCKLTCRLKHHPKASLEALGFPSRHCNTVSLDKLTRRHQTVAGHIKGLPSGWQVSQGSECPRLPPSPTLARGQPPVRDSQSNGDSLRWRPCAPCQERSPPVVPCVTNQLSPSVQWPTFITLTQEALPTPTAPRNSPAPPLIVHPLY